MPGPPVGARTFKELLINVITGVNTGLHSWLYKSRFATRGVIVRSAPAFKAEVVGAYFKSRFMCLGLPERSSFVEKSK